MRRKKGSDGIFAEGKEHRGSERDERGREEKRERREKDESERGEREKEEETENEKSFTAFQRCVKREFEDGKY